MSLLVAEFDGRPGADLLALDGARSALALLPGAGDGTFAAGARTPFEARGDVLDAAAVRIRPGAAFEVAVLFGAERTGLTNDELELCQRLLVIPTGSSYGSLNVAMAVQVVAYEILLATREASHGGTRSGIPLASAVDMERFYAHLEQVLEEIDFRDRTGEGHLMVRLRRFFNRAVPDQNEINILRGILTSVQGKRRRAGEPHASRAADPP